MPMDSRGEEIIPREELESIIPRELLEYFPRKEDALTFEYIKELDGEFFVGYVFSALQGSLQDALELFFQIVVIVLISSMAQNFSGGLGGMLGASAVYVPTLCAAVVVFSNLNTTFSELNEALLRVGGMLGGLSAVMGTLFLSSGNVNSAAVAGGETLLLMNIINFVTDKVLMSVLRICFALEVISLISSRREISSASSFARRSFVSLLSAVMAILSAVFTYQCSVSAGADSWILRSARFAAGSLPVVGGAISEAARTVFGSFELIRSVSGGVGIAVILLCMIPPFVKVVLYRWSLMLAGSFSEGVGATMVASVTKSAAELLGFALAVGSALGVTGIFTLTLLIKMGVS